MTSWAVGTVNHGYLWTPRTPAGKFMFLFGHISPRNSSAMAKDRYDSSCQYLPQIPPFLHSPKLVHRASETQAVSSHVVHGRVVSHGKPHCACHTVRPIVPSLQECRCRSKGYGSPTLTCVQCKNACFLRLSSQPQVRERLCKVLLTCPVLDNHFW